jgi:uracil-DNA glycosylase
MENTQYTNIGPGWTECLAEEFEREYMLELKRFILEELKKGKTIYPHGSEVFSAFKASPLEHTKVVIIGQDPYHGAGQAHGMCFSVKPGIKIPPSLANIYKEIEQTLKIKMPTHGHLQSWANQGVLLLNSVLTVEQAKAGAHHGKGWEIFTDRVIDILNEQKENLVFLLWGAPAQKKALRVDNKKHLVLKSPHPSPLSSYRGFFGQNHFGQANDYLQKNGLDPIDWKIDGH